MVFGDPTGDEQRLIHDAGAVAGALAYCRQLQAFLAKPEEEEEEEPLPDEFAPESQPNGGIPHREMKPHG